MTMHVCRLGSPLSGAPMLRLSDWLCTLLCVLSALNPNRLRIVFFLFPFDGPSVPQRQCSVNARFPRARQLSLDPGTFPAFPAAVLPGPLAFHFAAAEALH